jgi:NitT/TauT family transport system substrate-binding protein
MIDRRHFNLGLGGLAAVWAAGVSAQGRKVFRGANSVGIVDAQQCFITCGRHPKLRYFEQEGVELDFVNMSSANQAMVGIARGQAEFGSLAPGVYLPAIAKEPQLGIIAVYNWLPRNANVVVVKPDSPVKTIKDLAGKRIGIRNQGDGGVFALQTMYGELGMNASDIAFIAVGDSGVAGTALMQGNVDAIVTYDTAAARIEAVGMPLRYLDLPPNYARLGAGWMGIRRKDLKEDRKAVVGFFRAVAKSTLFAHTNLGEAINIHWALYPETKSKNKSDAESRKEIELILARRKDNWIRRPDDPDQRWGASSLEEWQQIVAITARSTGNPQLPQQLGDLRNVFTNELIDEINAFDKAAVVRQAQEFRLA